MKIKTIFPKSLVWLLPYYEEVHEFLPRHNLLKINHAHCADKKKQAYFGQLVKHVNSYKFTMTLYNQYWYNVSLEPFKRKRMNFSKIDLLTTFAHELAHIAHFDHTPNHKVLECLILMVFMGKLESEGYLSEEVELKKKR